MCVVIEKEKVVVIVLLACATKYISIIKIDPSSIIYRAEKESAKQILCEQCLLDDIKTEATRFCKSCKDPEPMCEICAKQHIRQKDSRDHEICQDLQMMSKKT